VAPDVGSLTGSPRPLYGRPVSWDAQRSEIEQSVPTAAPMAAAVMPEVMAAGPGSPMAGPLGPGAVVALQRSAGNAAVNGIMRQATLQRCAGGDCHCENCAGKHEHEGEEGTEGGELGRLELLLPEQDVQGQAGGGLHTPDLEAMAAADTDQPQTTPDGLPVPGAAGAQTDEAATPAQRALQREMAQVARSRLIQRVATWSASAPKETNNLAAAVMNGTAAGVTWPTLNGTVFWSNAEARGALVKPTVTTAAAGGGFEAAVDTVPTNLGSFDETVLSAGPWTTVVARGTIAAQFPALAQCSASGDTTFRAIGDPSDAEMQAANRRHEDKHAADHKAAFNATIVPWDTKLTAAKAAGTKYQGTTAAEAEANLWKAMGGTPDEIADAFMAKCAAAVVAYHGSAAGGPIGAPTGPTASADCSTSSAKYTNPS
jgi:hypothetical protein